MCTGHEDETRKNVKAGQTRWLDVVHVVVIISPVTIVNAIL